MRHANTGLDAHLRCERGRVRCRAYARASWWPMFRWGGVPGVALPGEGDSHDTPGKGGESSARGIRRTDHMSRRGPRRACPGGQAAEQQLHGDGQRLRGQPGAVHRQPGPDRPEGLRGSGAGFGVRHCARCGTWTAPAAWSGSGSTCAAVLATEAYSATNTFSYTRDDDRFEQVMAYFWVNQAQEYLQSPRLRDRHSGPSTPRARTCAINQYGVDNSLLVGQARLPPVRQGRRRRCRGR